MDYSSTFMINTPAMINTLGLEDNRFSVVFLQIAGWLSAENFENSV